MPSHALKWIYLITLSLIWGSSFILIKKGLIGLSPVQLGCVRIIFTATFLFIAGFKRIQHIPLKDWKWVGVTGLLGTFFPSFLFAYAETEIDSSVASILNALVPLNTVILGALVFKIKSTLWQVIGVSVGLLGTVFLILNGASVNPDQNYLYVFFVIAATLMYATSVNVLKRYLQHMEALTIAVGNFAFIVIPAAVILVFSGFFTPETLEKPELKPALLYMLMLSLFGTAIAKVMFNKLVHIATPVFASSVTYVMTIVAVFWGLLDGEHFGVLQALAALVILGGVYLANKKRK
jgi:drug/metabolite transporter (DMT)-like permease